MACDFEGLPPAAATVPPKAIPRQPISPQTMACVEEKCTVQDFGGPLGALDTWIGVS